MDVFEIKELVRSMNLTEDEKDLTFKAAVILWYGLSNNTVSYMKIKRSTDYWWKEVVFVLHNFRASGVITGVVWTINIGDDETENFFEIVLCAMAGAGEIVGMIPGVVREDKPISWADFLEKSMYCYGQQTILNRIHLDMETIRKDNERHRQQRLLPPPLPANHQNENETPYWLLEKQKKFKQIADKI